MSVEGESYNMANTLSKEEEKKTTGSGSETLKIIIHALIIATVVRVFFFQPFNIPSGSMIPTLLIGDYLFVSKYSYGYSRYSLPFGLNLFGGRILSSPPKRGDVAVFKLPKDNKTDYIKRVIGLPGDRIRMEKGVLFINDKPVPKKRIADFKTVDFFGNPLTIPQYEETLPNGVKYHVLDLEPNGRWDTTGEYIVPKGHYFMMGDNRDNSSDSRVSWAVGFVPFENFVGRATYLFFSFSDRASWYEFWKWPWTIRWSRIFRHISP